MRCMVFLVLWFSRAGTNRYVNCYCSWNSDDLENSSMTITDNGTKEKQ